MYVHIHTHTHTHLFNGPLSGSTRVSQYQKGKTNLDFTGARDSEWQWYQLGDMQVCISLQTDNHASTSLLKFFTGRMPFLPPNQQCQSTEGMYVHIIRHNFQVTLIWSDLTLYIIRLYKSKSFVMLHALHGCAVCCVAFHSWCTLVSLRTIHLSQKLAGILKYVLLGNETYCCLLLWWAV